MKLKVLADNNTFINMYYLGEPAVSYYIEDGATKILFDVGYSDAFIKNAQKMNIDVKSVDKLIISHGHNDHTGGLVHLLTEKINIELISHPDSFYYKEENKENIGSPLSQEELTKVCTLNLSKEPMKVSKNIIFLGEIPSSNAFETRKTIGKSEKDGFMVEDEVLEDSAICYKSEKGLFIITGCSHSGICNIIEYAKKVCNENRIYGVIGGFHLFENDERLKKTIDYLKQNNIELLYPCHCISLEAKIEMGKVLTINEVGVGLEINID